MPLRTGACHDVSMKRFCLLLLIALAPLARAEVRIMLDQFLEHTRDIDISRAVHGEPGNRKLEYEPSFIIRGLDNLHLELTARG